MKAFRNFNGNVVQIEVDLDLENNPILPPDTTVDPRPEAEPGKYVTVVGKEWVQIPITVEVVSFETKKQNKIDKLKEYRAWYLDQPVNVNDVLFDADETSRTRLVQALFMNIANGYLPPDWITYNNTRFPIADIDVLKNIANQIQVAFSNRFFEVNAIREQLIAATDETQLNAITIPAIPV